MHPGFGKILMASTLCIAGTAFAQQSYDLGKDEYDSKCASCHGATGKGDGVVRPYLVKAPSDLTTLKKRHGGAFPTDIAWQMIDGRPPTAIGAHGTREMPVWGREYKMEALQSGGPEQKTPEWYVRGRIVALIDYLSRIQAK